mgnify:CR=1 FL=1
MHKKNISIDEIDKRILELLQKDARTPLGQISNELGIPKSTISYRIRNLEVNKIIKGYYAEVDATKLGKDYTTIMFVRAKHGPNYPEKVGNLLAQIPGVCAVYFILGDNDFMVLTLSDNREELMKKLEKMYSMPDIERISTVVVGKIIKEDPRIECK